MSILNSFRSPCCVVSCAGQQAALMSVTLLRLLLCTQSLKKATSVLFNPIPLLLSQTFDPTQLTAALRNLLDHPDARPVFISFGLVSDLCLVLRLHGQDQDICTNISRICRYLSPRNASGSQVQFPPWAFPCEVCKVSRSDMASLQFPNTDQKHAHSLDWGL